MGDSSMFDIINCNLHFMPVLGSDVDPLGVSFSHRLSLNQERKTGLTAMPTLHIFQNYLACCLLNLTVTFSVFHT